MDDELAPKEKRGLGADSALSFAGASSLPETTSSTNLATSAEGCFLGVSVGFDGSAGLDGSVGLAPKPPKEKGELEELPAGTVGVNPPPDGAGVDVLGLGRLKEPAAGGAGMEKIGALGAEGAEAGVEVPTGFGAGATSFCGGCHPAFLADSSRCLMY